MPKRSRSFDSTMTFFLKKNLQIQIDLKYIINIKSNYLNIRKQKMDLVSQANEQFINKKSLEILKIARQNRVAKLSNALNIESLAPFTMVLEPFKISETEFEKLRKYSKLWQKITHLASTDSQFILKSLKNLKKDPMIGPMLKIFEQMVKFSEQQKLSGKHEQDSKTTFEKKPKILLFRTDFFITDDIPSKVKLIQYNNMSVSMAGISQQFQTCQKLLWGEQKNIIKNNCTETFSKGLVQFYKKKKLNGVILAVVQQKQTNVVDQGLLFQAIKSQSPIQIVKVFLQNLQNDTTIDENRNLIYKEKKVAIVYYRAGYSSGESISWAGIRKCNLSNAVNIPSINQFLIGTKKMQAELSKKQNMLRYLSQTEANTLMESVIETWDFQEKGSKQKLISMVEKEGTENFILKPNEQGGKHNLFGELAYAKLKQASEQQLLNYILTKKIKSRVQSCTLVQSNQWDHAEIKKCQIQSEVSIYGCVCSNTGFCCCSENCQCGCSGECFVNCCEGYLVRSKPEGVNEGGLMAGTGAICGLQLVQSNEL